MLADVARMEAIQGVSDDCTNSFEGSSSMCGSTSSAHQKRQSGSAQHQLDNSIMQGSVSMVALGARRSGIMRSAAVGPSANSSRTSMLTNTGNNADHDQPSATNIRSPLSHARITAHAHKSNNSLPYQSALAVPSLSSPSLLLSRSPSLPTSLAVVAPSSAHAHSHVQPRTLLSQCDVPKTEAATVAPSKHESPFAAVKSDQISLKFEGNLNRPALLLLLRKNKNNKFMKNQAQTTGSLTLPSDHQTRTPVPDPALALPCEKHFTNFNQPSGHSSSTSFYQHPAIRPILKKSTSASSLHSEMTAETSILDSFEATPRSALSSLSPDTTRARFHTSKSAPNLTKTQDWLPEYRAPGRRDSVKSLCFDNAIKKVCVFSSDESPARIAQSPRYVIESSDDESQSESDIEEITRHGSFECFDNLNHDPISFTPITKVYEPWLVSNRSHKLHSLTFPTVTLDSLSLSPSKSNTILSPSSMTIPPSGYTSKQPQRLTVSILIRNIAYSKYVIVRFTTDGWKSFQDLEASFQGVVIPITTSAPGVDRFTAIIDLDKLSPPVPAKYGSVYENGHDYEHNVLQFEFAVCGRVNGNEFWDNNCGRNHKLVLQRTIRLMPLMSAATVALMTASKGALKTVEAVIEAAQKAAVQSAYAVAEEAKAIDRAFEQSSSYRRSSLPSPHTLGIETVEFQPVRAQINPQAADAVGSPFVTLKPGILSLTSSSSFSDDDDCDDQDTIAATTVALDIPAYYSDWAFGAIQAEATCVELGCDSDSVTGIDQSSIQRPAQYQSDTLHSLLSRAGSPVSSEVTAFPSSFYHHHQQHLINHGQIVLHHGQQHHQQQQQQQNYIPPKNDPKSHVQTRPLKLETLQTGTSFKRDSSPIVESVPAERVSGSPAIQDVNSSKLLRQNRSSEFAQPQFPAQYLPQQQLQQRKHNGTSDSLEEVWNDTAEDMKHIIDRKVMESIEGWSLWERK